MKYLKYFESDQMVWEIPQSEFSEIWERETDRISDENFDRIKNVLSKYDLPPDYRLIRRGRGGKAISLKDTRYNHSLDATGVKMSIVFFM